jgi:hypothetical protein
MLCRLTRRQAATATHNRIIALPASGERWASGFCLPAGSLRSLPKRFTKAGPEFGIEAKTSTPQAASCEYKTERGVMLRGSAKRGEAQGRWPSGASR